MFNFENRNETQTTFNQVKGALKEINEAKEGSKNMAFGSITLSVGRSAKRDVNLICKSDFLATQKNKMAIGDLIQVTFYISSRNKNGRWHTVANVLQIDKLS